MHQLALDEDSRATVDLRGGQKLPVTSREARGGESGVAAQGIISSRSAPSLRWCSTASLSPKSSSSKIGLVPALLFAWPWRSVWFPTQSPLQRLLPAPGR